MSRGSWQCPLGQICWDYGEQRAATNTSGSRWQILVLTIRSQDVREATLNHNSWSYRATFEDPVYKKMYLVCPCTSCTWPYILTSHMGAQKQTNRAASPPLRCPAPLGPVLFMGREWLLRAWSQQNGPDRWQRLLFLSSKSFKPATKWVLWPQRSESFLQYMCVSAASEEAHSFILFYYFYRGNKASQGRWSLVTSAEENQLTQACCLWSCVDFYTFTAQCFNVLL